MAAVACDGVTQSDDGAIESMLDRLVKLVGPYMQNRDLQLHIGLNIVDKFDKHEVCGSGLYFCKLRDVMFWQKRLNYVHLVEVEIPKDANKVYFKEERKGKSNALIITSEKPVHFLEYLLSLPPKVYCQCIGMYADFDEFLPSWDSMPKQANTPGKLRLYDIPEDARTLKLCRIAVKKDKYSFIRVPKQYRVQILIDMWRDKDNRFKNPFPFLLAYVDEEEQHELKEMVLSLIKDYPWAIVYSKLGREAEAIACNQECRAAMYIPEEYVTGEMIDRALKEGLPIHTRVLEKRTSLSPLLFAPGFLPYMRPESLSPTTYAYAVEYHPQNFVDVPPEYITDTMLDKASKSAYVFGTFTESQKTEERCLIAVKADIEMIRNIRNPSSAVCDVVLDACLYMARYIDNITPEKLASVLVQQICEHSYACPTSSLVRARTKTVYIDRSGDFCFAMIRTMIELVSPLDHGMQGVADCFIDCLEKFSDEQKHELAAQFIIICGMDIFYMQPRSVWMELVVIDALPTAVKLDPKALLTHMAFAEFASVPWKWVMENHLELLVYMPNHRWNDKLIDHLVDVAPDVIQRIGHILPKNVENALLRNDPMQIQYVHDPTNEQCDIACAGDPRALQFTPLSYRKSRLPLWKKMCY